MEKNTIDIIAIFISGLSFILSVIALIGDIRIKKQQRKINAYQLKKIENAKQEESKADLFIRIESKDSDTFIFTIENKGKCKASNIYIKDLDSKSYLLNNISNQFPISIEPTSLLIFEIEKYCDMPNKVSLQAEWEDKLGKHSEIFVVSLLA